MKLALVDGYNLAFRAFYGMPELTRKDGFPTGALHGWVRSMWWLEDNTGADRMLVFFDLGGAQRQTALHVDYKANRTETPPALSQQIPVLKDWTRCMGWGGLEQDGVEADDLIATVAIEACEAGHEVEIVSADKDLGQLVRPGIVQRLPPPTAQPRLGWRLLDAAGVEEKFGVPPHMIPDYLALVGDTSDNIPGLRGVGPKTAVQWLRRYGSLAEIIANCGELQPKRFQGQVHAEQINLRRNLEMTTLHVKYQVDWQNPAVAEPERALDILETMEMTGTAKTLRERLKAG